MTKGISPELAGIAEAYDIKGETADELMAGIRAHMNKMSDDERQAFIVSDGIILVQAERDSIDARQEAHRQAELERHQGNEYEQMAAWATGRASARENEPARAVSEARAFDLKTAKGRGALVDLMWKEAQQAYDFAGLTEAQIEAAAAQVTQARGYQAQDFLDAETRREHMAVTAAVLGVKRLAGGKGKARAQEDDGDGDEPDNSRTKLSYGSRAGNLGGKAADAFNEGDENMNWLREVNTMQHKRGFK